MACKPFGSQLESGNINQLINTVDERSRQIITYFLRERHAGIRKLADLICASSDMEVLIRIREVINQRARELMGEPLLTFKHAAIDPLTGEKIAFSWWLNEKWIDIMPNDRLLDILDEENVIRIIASLPLEEKDVEVEVKDDFLIISGKKYYQEVPLFYSVKKNVTKTINNGVLEVRLKKSGEETWQ